MTGSYPQLHALHVAAVIASGLLFLLRGSMVVAGTGRAAMTAPLRYLSYAIDTVLLAAAIALTVWLELYPLEQPWLTAKLLLLVLYILLGSWALKRAKSRAGHAFFFAAAATTYLFIISVALAHHPLGALRGLLS